MGLFVVPGFLVNIKRSVLDGVHVSELDVRDSLLREEISRVYGGGVVRLWGLRRRLARRWAQVNVGDYLLFYNAGRFVCVGRVGFKYPFVDEAGQVDVGGCLAESVWGRDVDGETWPYLIFLVDVRIIDLSLDGFNGLTGYHLTSVPGFTRMRDERVEGVVEWLQREVYAGPPARPEPRSLEEIQHDDVVDMGFCAWGADWV